MRLRLVMPALIGLASLPLLIMKAGEVAPATPRSTTSKPFGLAKRISWTTSKVVGSPDPPLPYRVRRAFPKLQVNNPIGIAREPGTDQLLLIHQNEAWVGAGRILRVKDDGSGDKKEVFLSLDSTIYGLAFHPDYEKNGYLFVGSNGPVTSDDKNIPGQRFRPGAAKTTRVSRFTVDRKPPFACDVHSEKVIIEWPSNGHNGGDLAFGKDGMLYISSGDGTSDSDTDLAGQDITKLLSKVLRIDVEHPGPGKEYSVPPDNPFLKTEGARPETWAYGFRNPWRLHIDKPTGDLWVGNNGQDLWEEIYLVERGANYGWSVVEGSHPFYPLRKQGPTPLSKPIAEHHHSEARSMTGGVVYHGSQLPELRGAYIYGDWSTGKIWGIRHHQDKVTWHKELTDTTLQITGFGSDSKGELLIVDFGGGLYQLEPTPPEQTPAKFPTKLSETGLFSSVKDHQPEPALIPYSVNAPLWSDGADKERFIALPGSTTMDMTNANGWNCPEGTVLVKTFSLLFKEKNPASRRRMETRLLTRQQGEWVGYSYIWNDEQTEATLVDGKGIDRVYTLEDGTVKGGKRERTWHYPSRAECMVCHSRAANYVLGLSTAQMNKDHDYGGLIDNQLRTLAHIGVFKSNTADHFQAIKVKVQTIGAVLKNATGPVPDTLVTWVGNELQKNLDWLEERVRHDTRNVPALPKSADQYPRLVNPYDTRADLNARARSYLHANCAQCHVDAGGGNAAINLDFNAGLAQTRLLGVKPLHQTFDIPDAQLVAPGDPQRSVLYQRMSRRGPGQMPPLASSLVDQEAVRLLEEWIKQQKLPATGKN